MSGLGPSMHVMENHDEAYHVWRRTGVRDRVLVHIDAHHDMWWMPDPRQLSIANFVSPALAEGIVREVYWVVPDRSVATAANRAELDRHVGKIVAGYPGEPSAIQTTKDGIRTTVLGHPLTVCTLEALPPISEPVLLDVDTDYLVIPRVTYGKPDVCRALPWQWPADLVSRLRAKNLAAVVVTVAYSTEGAYTPIGFKYLGDELAYRLRQTGAPAGSERDATLEAFELMRSGITAEHRGDAAAAETAFGAIGDRLGAAPHFRLAYLLASHGRVEDGRRAHQRAVECDRSYVAPFVTPGVPLFRARAYAAAERAFRTALLLDPADACAHVGLGWIAARRRQWSAAASHARAALAIDADLIDAYRTLAEALDKQNQVPEAIRAYEQSLKLALRGHRPFCSLIATDVAKGRLVDGDHARTHARLAGLWERAGEMRRAVAGYRIAMAGGYRVEAIRSRLARLEARQRRAPAPRAFAAERHAR